MSAVEALKAARTAGIQHAPERSAALPHSCVTECTQ